MLLWASLRRPSMVVSKWYLLVKGKGIYTVIAMEELIVVNGIIATPYGGINPTLANLYYNLHRLMYTFVHVQTSVTSGLGLMQGTTEALWTMLSLST